MAETVTIHKYPLIASHASRHAHTLLTQVATNTILLENNLARGTMSF